MLETPSAVAASICLLARWRSGTDDAVSKIAVAAMGMRHPRPCGWCVYPSPELLRMVEEHSAADSQGYLTQRFRSLTATAQRDLVDAAQGLEPAPATAALYRDGVPAPMPDPAPAPERDPLPEPESEPPPPDEAPDVDELSEVFA